MSETASDFRELARLPSADEAKQLRFVLAAVGIESQITLLDLSNGVEMTVWRVAVPAERLEQAAAILEEERPAPIIPLPLPRKKTPLYWLVGLIVSNVCVFIAMEGSGGSENLVTLGRFGASQAAAIAGGQWWRTITAVFLHIGARHLLGNMVMLAVLGPTTLRQWGAGRFYAIYVIAGVGGNWASFLLSSSTAIKAGASGAILGLLGALAGWRLRTPRPGDEPSRFKTWHVLAMLLAFYGFAVGVGRADHLAHMGGIVVGLALAYLLPRPGDLSPKHDRRLALASGAIAGGAVAGAGALTVLLG